MPFGICLFPEVSFQSPFGPGLILAKDGRYVVSYLSAKEYHGRAQSSEWVRGVSVEEDGASKPISVQLSPGTNVLHNQTFGRFDSHFTTFICPGVIGTRDSVFNTPPVKEVLALGRGEDFCTI